MNEVRHELMALLGIVASAIRGLSDEQYENLVNGKARLVYRESVSKPAAKVRVDLEASTSYLEHLQDMSSREEALAYLQGLKLKKDILLEMCGEMEIHVLKSDTREKLMAKLVESLVGARLRSEAIRSSNLKG